MDESLTTAADCELTFSRDFDAPRDLVWKAWTDPQHIGRWWGPKGFTTTVVTLDLRAGGRFVLSMKGPDGRAWPCEGTYLAVDSPERLAFRGEASDGHACGGGLPPRAIVTVTFTELSGRTTVTIHTRLENRRDRDAAIAMGYREGWTDSLASLALVVETASEADRRPGSDRKESRP